MRPLRPLTPRGYLPRAVSYAKNTCPESSMGRSPQPIPLHGGSCSPNLVFTSDRVQISRPPRPQKAAKNPCQNTFIEETMTYRLLA